MTGREPIDTRAVLDRVDLVQLVQARGVALKHRAHRWSGLCPFHQERTPSFSVVPAKRFFHCFGCGAHGDAIEFIRRLDRIGFREAVERLGGPQVLTEADRRRILRQAEEGARRESRSREAKTANAVGLWDGAGPAEGSPVEQYLRGRAVDLDAIGGIPAVLRHAIVPYHWLDESVDPAAPRAERFKVLARLSAMVAMVQGPDGAHIATHVTWLQDRSTRDGLEEGYGLTWVKAEVVDPATGEILPAKKILGRYFGGAIRLTPSGPTMRAGEGIETSMTVLGSLRRAGRDDALWALASLGNFAGSGLGHGPRKPGTRQQMPDGRVRWQRRQSPVPDLARPGFLPPAEVKRFGWLGDADGKDPEDGRLMVERGLARYRARGVDAFVTWAAAGSDFNDMARGRP